MSLHLHWSVSFNKSFIQRTRNACWKMRKDFYRLYKTNVRYYCWGGWRESRQKFNLSSVSDDCPSFVYLWFPRRRLFCPDHIPSITGLFRNKNMFMLFWPWETKGETWMVLWIHVLPNDEVKLKIIQNTYFLNYAYFSSNNKVMFVILYCCCCCFWWWW
jgi:hypothetical protein